MLKVDPSLSLSWRLGATVVVVAVLVLYGGPGVGLCRGGRHQGGGHLVTFVSEWG
jgi:hypothetical protein